jgi:hypothetical protein
MAAVWNLYKVFVFGFTTVTNEQTELDMRNSVRTEMITILTNRLKVNNYKHGDGAHR